MLHERRQVEAVRDEGGKVLDLIAADYTESYTIVYRCNDCQCCTPQESAEEAFKLNKPLLHAEDCPALRVEFV